eukprot:GHRR01025666.1.p1 GENE.GHRR01025666.1~~GHRR01025666.1.p1  ORF type:complete len:112 (+),score=18.17 GHRR01025666.1:1408-1743(+)
MPHSNRFVRLLAVINTTTAVSTLARRGMCGSNNGHGLCCYCCCCKCPRCWVVDAKQDPKHSSCTHLQHQMQQNAVKNTRHNSGEYVLLLMLFLLKTLSLMSVPCINVRAAA